MRGGAVVTLALALTGCPTKAAPPDAGVRAAAGRAAPLPMGGEIVDAWDGTCCPKGPAVEAAVRDSRTFYFCSAENRRQFLGASARTPLRTP